jgi:hypothetical protein
MRLQEASNLARAQIQSKPSEELADNGMGIGRASKKAAPHGTGRSKR